MKVVRLTITNFRGIKSAKLLFDGHTLMVVVRKSADVTEAQLRAHCAEHLTGYKRPKYIEFRDNLPKTPVGKILRRELRDETSKA